MLVMVVCCIKVLHTVCIERLSNLVKYVKRKQFVTHLMFFFDDDGHSPGQKLVFYNTGLTTLYITLYNKIMNDYIKLLMPKCFVPFWSLLIRSFISVIFKAPQKKKKEGKS